MNIKNVVVLLIVLGLSGCSCLKQHDKPDFVVINVLDPDLYNDCHIKGSINVPFEKLEHFAQELDHNTQVVLYCSNYKCTASGFGAHMLKKMGFEHVWAYEAGMAGWYQQGLPTEGPAHESYLKLANPPLSEEGTDKKLIISTDELQQKMAGFSASGCATCGCDCNH